MIVFLKKEGPILENLILMLAVLLSFAACTPSPSRQKYDALMGQKEHYIVDKESLQRSDIDSVVKYNKAMRDFLLEFPEAKQTSNVETMVVDVYAKAKKLADALHQDTVKQQNLILTDLLPLIDAFEKISTLVLGSSKKRSIFEKVKVKKGECIAVYHGRELEKFKINLKMGKIVEVGTREIKLNIIIGTRNFTLQSYPKLIQRIGKDELVYNSELRDSISVNCDQAHKLSGEFLEFRKPIQDVLEASKDYFFLSMFLKTYEDRDKSKK